jgi:hypothetical protein
MAIMGALEVVRSAASGGTGGKVDGIPGSRVVVMVVVVAVAAAAAAAAEAVLDSNPLSLQDTVSRSINTGSVVQECWWPVAGRVNCLWSDGRLWGLKVSFPQDARKPRGGEAR